MSNTDEKKQINIRPATAADLPILREFEQGVIAAERPFDPTLKPDPIEYYDLEALMRSPAALLLVAETDGQIVGSGYGKIADAKTFETPAQYVYLGFMFVRNDYRGRGVNRMVLESLFAWAKELGIFDVRLDVYAENEIAVQAYRKAGFAARLIEMRVDLSTRP